MRRRQRLGTEEQFVTWTTTATKLAPSFSQSLSRHANAAADLHQDGVIVVAHRKYRRPELQFSRLDSPNRSRRDLRIKLPFGGGVCDAFGPRGFEGGMQKAAVYVETPFPRVTTYIYLHAGLREGERERETKEEGRKEGRRGAAN